MKSSLERMAEDDESRIWGAANGKAATGSGSLDSRQRANTFDARFD
jgi:hypothetical protein